jgi:hypothetical protein
LYDTLTGLQVQGASQSLSCINYVPPSTTTTTTTIEEVTTTTTTTTVEPTTTTTTTTICIRPDGLLDGAFIYECNNGSDPMWEFSTVSVEDACNAWKYYRVGSGGTISSRFLNYESPLNIGDKVYWDNGTMDCYPFYDGIYWFQPDQTVAYFRNLGLTQIYIVTIVNSTIMDIDICTIETTTTTTTIP